MDTMADEPIIPAVPSDAPKQEEAINTTTPTPPDLVTRVSEVKPKPDPTSNGGYDKEAHDTMIAGLSPELQSQVKAYEASVMSGANKKFMAAADKEKELAQPWTTDRVQQLLNDQTFVASAQEIAQKQALAQNPTGSGLQDQEWSALTDVERKQFYAIQQNQVQMQAQMNTMLSKQEDQNLMTRYKNYDASAIDKAQDDYAKGRVNATREHVHKILDYDDAVKRAYEMGKEDRQTDIQGKVDASTLPNGVNTTQASDVPIKDKGVGNVQHFVNLAQARIKQFNQQSGRT